MLKEQILDLSRQSKIGVLSPWFNIMLDHQIANGTFQTPETIAMVGDNLVHQLEEYMVQTGASTVVLGMSGGVDSALTAALFKQAGYRVIGVTMPIHQNPEETERGVEACRALGIEHIHKDLSDLYDAALANFADIDFALINGDAEKATKIRKGNIRARLRMVTLYDLASLNGGFVASTDNYSELGAGFWTLHGDVGDVSPIQSLLKSWEVPFLAREVGVPESTWRATPTDGLGIDAGDEAQLGSTYLEWDIMVAGIQEVLKTNQWATFETLPELLGLEQDERAMQVFTSVTSRMRASWFKRMNPVNIRNPIADRYTDLDMVDYKLFKPEVVK